MAAFFYGRDKAPHFAVDDFLRSCHADRQNKAEATKKTNFRRRGPISNARPLRGLCTASVRAERRRSVNVWVCTFISIHDGVTQTKMCGVEKKLFVTLSVCLAWTMMYLQQLGSWCSRFFLNTPQWTLCLLRISKNLLLRVFFFFQFWIKKLQQF